MTIPITLSWINVILYSLIVIVCLFNYFCIYVSCSRPNGMKMLLGMKNSLILLVSSCFVGLHLWTLLSNTYYLNALLSIAWACLFYLIGFISLAECIVINLSLKWKHCIIQK